MNQVIELRGEVFTALQAKADAEGLTPEAWIEARLGINDANKQTESNVNHQAKAETKKKAWDSFIGAVDSSKSSINKENENEDLSYSERLDKMFGEILIEKARKQGLNFPE
jgi:hypothetical protein